MALLLNAPFTSVISGVDSVQANGVIRGGQNVVDGLDPGISGYLEIAAAPDGSMGLMCRISPADADTYGGKRSEVDWTPEPLGERWYVWDVFFPVDFDPSGRFSFMQIHDSPDGGESVIKFPNFEFCVTNNTVEAWVPRNTPDESTGSGRVIGTAPMMKGRWVKACLHVNWQTDNTGFLEAFFNGRVVCKEWLRPSHFVDAVGPYIKLGLYELFHVGFSGTRTAWYRNFKVYSTGHSYVDVLGVPPEPGRVSQIF